MVKLKAGTNTVYEVDLGDSSSHDAQLSYYQFGNFGTDLKANLLTNLVHSYMSESFVSELKHGHGMTKVAMREAHFRDCSGMWLLGMSDKHSAEEMSGVIN